MNNNNLFLDIIIIIIIVVVVVVGFVSFFSKDNGWTAPEMSVHCIGAASTVTVKSNY